MVWSLTSHAELEAVAVELREEQVKLRLLIQADKKRIDGGIGRKETSASRRTRARLKGRMMLEGAIEDVLESVDFSQLSYSADQVLEILGWFQFLWQCRAYTHRAKRMDFEQLAGGLQRNTIKGTRASQGGTFAQVEKRNARIRRVADSLRNADPKIRKKEIESRLAETHSLSIRQIRRILDPKAKN